MNHATFSSRQIGDFQITALSDGDMAASLELLSGIETAQAEAIQRDVGLTEPGNIHIYCYLNLPVGWHNGAQMMTTVPSPLARRAGCLMRPVLPP